MITKNKLLFYVTALILATYFLFLGLTKAKGFFAPLLTAVILSLVVLPLSQIMEKKMKRPLAAILNSLITISNFYRPAGACFLPDPFFC